MADPLHLLLVEDNPMDVELMQAMLEQLARDSLNPVTITVTPVETLQQAIDSCSNEFDGVLLDLTLPDSRGIDTVSRFVEQAHRVPVIVLTGTNDEQLATAAVQKGAQDYLIKGQINSALLERSVRYAIERFNILEEKEQLIEELQEALATIKTLRGCLPICSHCKKIRNDKGYWERLESYIHEHSEAEFTHSLCPECLDELYPELSREKTEE